MASTTAMATSFRVELLTGDHHLDTDSLKIALIKSSPAGTYGAASTNYSDITGNSDEVTGTGYTAGGAALTAATPTSSGTTAYADFTDVVWSTATVTASAAMIYNTTLSNAAVCVLDFGGDKTSTAADFTVSFPTADASNAIIRITD